MIKINLLPQKRAKLRGGAGATRGRGGGAAAVTADAGMKQLALGVAALAAAGIVVFFGVDKPKRDAIKAKEQAMEDLNTQISEKQRQLKGYEDMRKAKTDAQTRADSINRLMAAKVVPAHVLHELGEILTQGRLPAMTEDMRKKVGNGPGSDPNKRFQLDWDPTKVWINGFTDKDGTFKLDGGAQSEQDVTQLAKRLAASVYFSDVTPAGGERTVDRDRGVNYYKFTITGKLAY